MCLKFEHCHITCGLACEIADVNKFESITVSCFLYPLTEPHFSAEECSGATKRCPKSEVIERTLSASEKDRAFRRVRAFESKNPFFKVVMQPSYVYRRNSLVSFQFKNLQAQTFVNFTF